MVESAPRARVARSPIKRFFIFAFGAIGVVSGTLGIVQFFSEDRDSSDRITGSIESLRSDVQSVSTSQESIRKETQSIDSRLSDLLRRYDALLATTADRIERPLADANQALESASAAVQQGHGVSAVRMDELDGRFSRIYDVDAQINNVEAEREQLASALVLLQSMGPGDQGTASLVAAVQSRDRQLSDQLVSLRSVRAAMLQEKEQFTKYISEHIPSAFENKYLQ